MNRLRLLITTSRPISWINTAFPYAAGYVMLGGAVDARLIIGSLFFLIPYNLIMYGVNDVYDYESDIRNPRKGGIEGAITPKEYHPYILGASVVASAPFLIYMLVTGTPINALVLSVLLFFVIAYSIRGLRFKEKPVLDSITSSIHFVGPLVYAFSTQGASREAWLIAGAFFLWGVASHAFGAVQDILPDREGGIASIATVFGARNTVRFSTTTYFVAVIVIASLTSPATSIVALSGVTYIVNTARFLHVTDETSAKTRSGWRTFLWLNYVVGAVVTMVCIATLLP